MNLKDTKRILRRTWGFAFIEINLSVMITVLSLSGVFTTQQQIFHSTAVGGIIYALVNIFRMRINFYEQTRIYRYFYYNLVGYAIFAVISLAVYFLADGTVYTWLFALLKIFRYYEKCICWNRI